MSTAVLERRQTVSQKAGIFDCDIHPMLKQSSMIREWLPARWQAHFDTYGDFIRQPFLGALAYPKATPALSRRDAWPPAGGPPGSDLDFMREQHLDPNNVECGVLQVLYPVANKQRNPGFAAAMCTAVNDWQIDEWTSKEPRLKGSILSPQEDIDAAVAEIDRVGHLPDFAQVLISPRSEEPIGRRRYWPLFRAAVRHNRPVAFHVGGVNGRPPTGTGHVSFYAEEHHSHVHYMQAVVASLILEGVFEEFPDLRVVMVEAGLAWVPSLGWRLDQSWERLGDEVPHVKKRPSDYLRKHFWFSTQPADEPERPEHLRDLFDWIGWDRVLFASDYPHWDYDDPKYAIQLRMNEAERQLLFRDNARVAYGMA